MHCNLFIFCVHADTLTAAGAHGKEALHDGEHMELVQLTGLNFDPECFMMSDTDSPSALHVEARMKHKPLMVENQTGAEVTPSVAQAKSETFKSCSSICCPGGGPWSRLNC